MRGATKVSGDFIKFGAWVLVYHSDQIRAVIATKPGFRCEYNETLKRFLPAFRAGQRIDLNAPAVGICHGISLKQTLEIKINDQCGGSASAHTTIVPCPKPHLVVPAHIGAYRMPKIAG